MKVTGTLNPISMEDPVGRSNRAEDEKKLEQEYLASLGKTTPAELTILGRKKDIPDYNVDGLSHDVIRRATTQAQEIHARQVEESLARHRSRLGRMVELQAEKERLAIEPMTKEDLAHAALAALAEKKAEVKQAVLGQHLAGCQVKRRKCFELLWVDFSDGLLHDMFILTITEDDVKAAIASLPDVKGLSRKEYDREVKKLDAEIARLAAEISEEAERGTSDNK